MRQLKITNQITPRNSQSIDKYLNEIMKIKVLSAEEEYAIIKKIKSGDKNALQKLIACNLRFVVSVAKQYQNQGLPLDDLINEGNIGLLKATENFDESKGFKFISYAVWWIRQTILQAIADQARLIRLPINKVTLINKINKCSDELEQKLHRTPTCEEIAHDLDINIDVVKEHICLSENPLSMDSPITNKDDKNRITFYDIHTPENHLSVNPDITTFKESLDTDIRRFFSTLTKRESIVLILYYGLNGQPPMSMEEVANELDLTTERIRQLKSKALRKLIQCKNIDYLKCYL